MELGQKQARRVNVYCRMCTKYVTYMYACVPAQLYLGILGKLGAMHVLLQKKEKQPQPYVVLNPEPSINPASMKQSP